MEDLADAVASSIGGIITVAVTYPIEIVKNRIASASSGTSAASGLGGVAPPPSALSVARAILKSRGPLGLYDGVMVSAVQNAWEKFMYFYAYSLLRRGLQAARNGPAFSSDLVAGCLAEIAHLPVSVPMETLLIKVVNNPEQGALAAVEQVIREQGVMELYAGTLASALLSIKPAIQLATFEALKQRFLRLLWSQGGAVCDAAPRAASELALSAGQAFLFGALARAIATVIVFPYIRAKFMLKNMTGEGEEEVATGAMAPLVNLHRALALIFRRQGFAGLYQGLWQELARAAMSAALLMAIRERLTLVLKQLFLGPRSSLSA